MLQFYDFIYAVDCVSTAHNHFSKRIEIHNYVVKQCEEECNGNLENVRLFVEPTEGNHCVRCVCLLSELEKIMKLELRRKKKIHQRIKVQLELKYEANGICLLNCAHS